MLVLARMISPLPLQKSNKPLGAGVAVRRGREPAGPETSAYTQAAGIAQMYE